MPVKNAARWLTETLESIREQSFSDWELIAINDHSTDSSYEMLTEIATMDRRIHVFTNDGNGIIESLQLAMRKANGDFITRMDADDVMPPNKLSLMFEKLNQRNDVVVTGLVQYFSNNQVSKGYRDYQTWLNDRCRLADHWSWIYRECVIASANWLTHRSNINLNTNKYPEDYDLVFNWYQKRLQVSAIDEVTHLWREHPDRTSRSSEHYQQQSFFQLKITWFLLIDHNPLKRIKVLGKNQKSKLVASILREQDTHFEMIDETSIEKIDVNRDQVLSCVYPKKEDRTRIEAFMYSKQFQIGKNWWYL